ncbi:MAG: heavy-metal-associated domain-containing protein [Sediminibacterium sp.]|jgi:copper chaperone CopZ|nr:heavy-metal-associated domain-containing protein [Hydrotalea sp.]MCU0336818.1 heavy-metal-associated domain-containing protein [Sediminibacterium sp.]
MKKILLVFSLLLVVFYSNAQFRSATLQASGLTCSLCSKSILKSIEKIPFVQSVKADIQTSGFEIEFQENQVVDFDQIKKAVEDAGFSVARLDVQAIISETAIQPDAHIEMGGLVLHFMNVKKQQLQGVTKLRIIDKSFLPAKEHKKMSQYTKMACFQTGVMESCCTSTASTPKTSKRVYHVTL